MSDSAENRIEQARKRLMKRFPIEKIREIPKYRNCNEAQYLHLIEKLESIAVLLLESYIFTQSNTT